MELSRIRALAEDGDLTIRDDVQIEGADPILPSRFPIGEIAGVALAGLGSAAADLAAEAGGKPGVVKTSAVEGALTTIGFSAQRLNGEASARTNQSNPFVHCPSQRRPTGKYTMPLLMLNSGTVNAMWT